MPRIATTFWGKNELFTALLLSHRLENFLIAKRFKLNRTGHKITVSEANNKKAQFLIPCAVLTTTAVMVWRNDVLIEEDDALSWFIHMVQVHFDLLLLWAIVICNLLHSTVQTKTIDRFLQLDRKLRTVGLRIDNLSIRRTSFLWFFVNVGLTMTVFAYYILKMGEDFRYLWAHCVYLISNVYKIFLAVVVRDWIISIKMRMDAVVRYLRDVTRRSQTAKEISERSANLMELMDVCGGFNRIYSVPMLVNMMCNFTQIIIGLYRYSTVLTELPVSHILFIAIGISTFAMNAVVNIWVCSTLSNYQRLLKQALWKLSVANKNAHLRKELSAFSLQLLHSSTKITAGGFFDMDLPLIFTMVGAGTTYLVILVQFNIAVCHKSTLTP